jgi:2'-hydroxyisoflavone reductase
LIVGPTDPTDRFTYWPVRLAKGGEVLAPGSPSDPVQVIDVRDLAEWTIRMVEKGVMGTFNAVGPKKTLTVAEMLAACQKASGVESTLVWGDTAFLEAENISAWGDMPVWVPPVGDSAGFTRISNQKALKKGMTFRPIELTAKDTLDWWNGLPEERRAKLKAGISPEREAAALAKLKARAPSP